MPYNRRKRAAAGIQPYQMVKDLRTDVETSDTTGVLDGDIERFVEAYVRCGGKPQAQ